VTDFRPFYSLIPEQITGIAFMAHRADQQHSYFYRIRPSVAHDGHMLPLPDHVYLVSDFSTANPHATVHSSRADGVGTHHYTRRTNHRTMMGSGDAHTRNGLAIHVYAANKSMDKEAFVNNGDMCIIVQQGRLDIETEFGKLMVHPGELAVIQRGIRSKILLPDGPYVQEIYSGHYKLPELGPLGGSGLASKRDFLYPSPKMTTRPHGRLNTRS
jgi:homogentisate 1,2-dioxygenase